MTQKRFGAAILEHVVGAIRIRYREYQVQPARFTWTRASARCSLGASGWRAAQLQQTYAIARDFHLRELYGAVCPGTTLGKVKPRTSRYHRTARSISLTAAVAWCARSCNGLSGSANAT